jgi:hypothetical protein
MYSYSNRSRAITIALVSLPFALLGAYIAYLIVPEILKVVVPTVVEELVGH